LFSILSYTERERERERKQLALQRKGEELQITLTKVIKWATQQQTLQKLQTAARQGFFIIIILLLCWVGVHGGICESSYNVSDKPT
jgi:hypothetical protein